MNEAYGNKITEYKGRNYHSKFEAENAQILDLRMHEKGPKRIVSWTPQFRIRLKVNGFLITTYIIDFIALREDGITEYIEVKGHETKLWKVKWKLFKALYNEEKDIEFVLIK